MNKSYKDILEEPTEAVQSLSEPRQLTHKNAADRADAAANDISVLDNTLYIELSKIGKASAWYDDITKAPTLWNAVPISDECKSFMLVCTRF